MCVQISQDQCTPFLFAVPSISATPADVVAEDIKGEFLPEGEYERRWAQLQLWLKKRHPGISDEDVIKFLDWHMNLTPEEHHHITTEATRGP